MLWSHLRVQDLKNELRCNFGGTALHISNTSTSVEAAGILVGMALNCELQMKQASKLK